MSSTSSQPLIALNVRASKDKTYPITVVPTDTVLQLKEQVALSSGTSSDRIRLVYSGRVLKDSHSIESYNVAHGNIIHMVRSPVPSTTTTTKVATSAAEAATLTTVQTSPTSPYSTRQQTTGAFGSHTQSGLPSIATSTTRQQQPCHPRTHPTNVSSGTHHPGFGGFGFSNNTGFDSNGAHGPGEEVETMMSQMMQDPTFAQFMSSMLQNPQILESMIATNPMLQTMLGPDVGRRVLQSPQFRHMVASPEALRQVAQMGGVSSSVSSPTTTVTTTNSNSSNNNANATFFNPTSTSIVPSTTTPPPSSAPGMRLLPSSLISANAPEKRFQVQLQLLSEMGFWDPTKNMRALQVTGGDVNSAIEILCSGV